MKRRRPIWNYDVYELTAEEPTAPIEAEEETPWDRIDSEQESDEKDEEDDW
jgi:hypothetical protein